jgi:hypothetical protein
MQTIEIRKGAKKEKTYAGENVSSNIRAILNNMEAPDQKPLPLD